MDPPQFFGLSSFRAFVIARFPRYSVDYAGSLVRPKQTRHMSSL
jgi:hypothetical protein